MKMKRKKLVKILGTAVILTGVMALFGEAYIKRKTEAFERIQRKCSKNKQSILDDQGNASTLEEDDTIIMEESHNCLAKKALYEVLNEDSKELKCDLFTLAQFVNEHCENCKRKGSHGYNISN